MSEQNDQFRNMNLKEKVKTFFGVTLILIVVLGFIIGIYLFGMAGIFTLLGIEYNSIWSLIIFVVGFFIFASIVELVFEPISDFITESIPGKFKGFLIEFIILCLSNWFCLNIVDFFMDSISLTLLTGLIVAILVSLIELSFHDKKK